MCERQRWVVTGGASGIGEAVALLASSRGHDVVVLDRKQPEPSLAWVEADLASIDERSAAWAEASANGYFDVLVNCAAELTLGPAEEVNLEDWRRVLAVNLEGPFHLCQLFAADAITGPPRPRAVVNVSSIHAALSEPSAAPYTAAKGGLEAVSLTLASEWARLGIRVVCVRPGATFTPMNRETFTPEVVTALNRRIPLARIGDPGEVAEVVCFAASHLASYMTGTTIVVDGGFSTHGGLPGLVYSFNSPKT